MPQVEESRSNCQRSDLYRCRVSSTSRRTGNLRWVEATAEQRQLNSVQHREMTWSALSLRRIVYTFGPSANEARYTKYGCEALLLWEGPLLIQHYNGDALSQAFTERKFDVLRR